MSQQIRLVEEDLQILKDENVVLQSERNPEFRKRLEAEVVDFKEELDRARRVVTSARDH